MERVKKMGFNRTFTMTLVNDHLFYEGNDTSVIYSFFRAGETINNLIIKPTGKKDESITLNAQYKIIWQRLSDNRRYYLLEL